MEVGDKQKNDEMAKKVSQCREASEDGLSYFLSFPTWRKEMSKKVNEIAKMLPQCW